MSGATVTREWRVIVRGRDIGSVVESSEEFARCAAVSKFGIEGERATVHALDGNPVPRVIYEDDDFDVRPV